MQSWDFFFNFFYKKPINFNLKNYFYYFIHFTPFYTEWVNFIEYYFDFINNSWFSWNNNLNLKITLIFFINKTINSMIVFSCYFLDLIEFKKIIFKLNYLLCNWKSFEYILISLNTAEIYLSSSYTKFFISNIVYRINIIFQHNMIFMNHHIDSIYFIDYIVLWYFFILSTMLLTSCYLNIFYENTTVDLNYLFSSLLILAEKEINCLDDLINFLIIFFFLFGWFFYLTGFFNNTYLEEIKFLMIIIPLMCYSLILIPFYLLIDFSYNFISYLRGVSVSTSVAVEFIFDYINFFGFILRTYVQNVRFILIILVFFSINELWFYFDTVPTFFGFNKPNINNIFDEYSSYNSYIYLIIFFIFKVIIYFIYEIIHTFTIIVIQLSSFLIMIFWLFSFLYTYFSILIHENFFEKLKEEKIKKYNLHEINI